MKARGERGVYLVLIALSLVAILALTVLYLGTGYLAGNKEIIRMNANTLALAALEGYSRKTGTYGQRIQAGLDRAEELFQANKTNLIGIDKSLQQGLGLEQNGGGFAGSVQFGTYFAEKGANSPCGGQDSNYPCFIPIHENEGDFLATGVSVTLRTQGGVSVPFVPEILKNVSETSYAYIVPRCVAAAIDLSGSTMGETHRFTPPAGFYSECGTVFSEPRDTWCRLDPDYYADWGYNGLYSYNKQRIGDFSTLTYCTDHPPFPQAKTFFCSMYTDRANAENPPINRPDLKNDLNAHFLSDYSIANGVPQNFETDGEKIGNGANDWLLVDRLKRDADSNSDADATPEPFGRFMRAVNGLLRVLRELFTQDDRAILVGFTGEIKTTIPGNGDHEYPGLTKNIEYLLQITNTRNTGFKIWNGTDNEYVVVQEPIYPNLLTKNFFPIYTTNLLHSSTNLLIAMVESGLKLGGSGGQSTRCPESSRRGIILFSDGMNTCLPKNNTWGNIVNGWPEATYLCGRDDIDNPVNGGYVSRFYDMWSITTKTGGGVALPDYLLNSTRGIWKNAVDSKVSVSIILDGEQILGTSSNPIPIFKKTVYGDGFLRYEDLKQHPERAKDLYVDTPICPNWVSACTDSLIMQHLGEPGWHIRTPLKVLAEFTAKTGGDFIPLLPECAESTCPSCPDDIPGNDNKCYESNISGARIRDCALQGSGTLSCSMTRGTKAQQAAWAASRLASSSPFALTQPAHINP